MGINGGRNLRGVEDMSGFKDYHILLPNSIIERLEKFMKDEERPRSWVIQKALDEWLKKKGY
jgi:predicted DNA-binding protein